LDNPRGMELPPCRLATWADVDRWADTLADRIRPAGDLPETLVALTRGGWVPARLVADRLGLTHLVALRAQHWGVTATPSGNAQITEGLASRLEGRDVLVVDDITDTGQSLELAARHVREMGAARVRSATFLHITHSQFVPTYYAEEIPRDSWVWVIFPWNYWEDLRTLSARALTIGAPDLESVLRILRERCRVDFPRAHVARVLPPQNQTGNP
jgi:hypoxanthine phosphoribosyltransferase